MDKKQTSRSWAPSIAFSLLTAFIAFVVLFALAYGLAEVVNEDAAELIAYISHIVIIIIGCFFICRKFSFSIWYAPVICNVSGIISAIVEPNFWISSLWVIFCSCWVLSLITSFIGYRMAISKAQNQ